MRKDSQQSGGDKPAAPTSTDQLSKALTWIGTSAGLTGVLAAFGYVADASRSEFLGIQGGHLSLPDYVQTAGSFLLETLLTIVAACGEALNRIGLPIALALTVAAAALWMTLVSIDRRKRLRRFDPRTSGRFAILLVCALSIGRLAYWDFPITSYQSVLLRSADCASLTVAPGLLSARTAEVWRDVLCSRVERGFSGNQSPKGCLCAAPEVHATGLRKAYVQNLAIVLVVMFCSVFVRQRITGNPPYIAATLLVLVNLLNVVSVPLIYGRLIASTVFSKGKLIVETKGTGNDTPIDPNPIRKGYLLSQTESRISFFDTEVRSVVSLPSASVIEVDLDTREDVLRQRLNLPASDAQPAPPAQQPATIAQPHK